MNNNATQVVLKNRGRLSIRIVVVVLLCSSILTLLTTAVQLYFDYQKDVKTIHSNIQFIQDSYLPAIISSVYTLDEKQVEILLEGSLNILDIEYIEIEDRSKNLFKSVGNSKVSRDVTKVFPLDFTTPSGKVISVGILKVFVSLEGIYHRLLEKAFVILLSNTVKTFFASILFLMIINHMVVRHLISISNFTRTLNLDKLCKKLILNQKFSKIVEPDELGQLVHSINAMIDNIKSDADKIKKIQSSLQEREDYLKSIFNTAENVASRFV